MNLISRDELKTLAEKRDGWRISVYLPTHRTGQEKQQDPIRLKNLLGEAEERLQAADVRRSLIEDMLAPAQALVPDAGFWRYQMEGLALFLAVDFDRILRLPRPFEAQVIVSRRFHIKPLLPLLSGDGRFYVLALSQSEIRLLEGSRFSVDQVRLPSVPAGLEEALKWDDPESQLQWHSGTGARTDGRAAVFHGHGVGVDNTDTNILRYFQKVDAGLQEVLAGERAPLVLAGVDSLFPIYREANSYANLVTKGIPGSPDMRSPEELHSRAWPIVEPIFQQDREEAAERYQVAAAHGQASSELAEVLTKAYHGGVETLFVNLEATCWGTFDADRGVIEIAEEPGTDSEDLLDLTAVHALLYGGTVYAVPTQSMPVEGNLAAIYRF